MSYLGGCGPAILGVLWTLVVLAGILMALRTYTASFRAGKPRWDFIWMALAFVTAVAAAVTIQISVTQGIGNHLSALPLDTVWSGYFWFYLTIYIGTISIAFSKFAVIALLLDVYKGSKATKRKWALWGIGALFAITTLLEIFLTAFQCSPTKKVWNLLAAGECKIKVPARTISYVHAGVGAGTDIILALWPISIVWDLNASRYIKLSICALMGLGVIPGVAALVRADLLVKLHSSSDPTYTSGLFLMSAAIEAGSLIIVGCIPPLRPLFSRVFKGLSITSSKGTSHPTTTHATATVKSKRTVLDELDAEDKEMSATAAPILVERTYRIETASAGGHEDV